MTLRSDSPALAIAAAKPQGNDVPPTEVDAPDSVCGELIRLSEDVHDLSYRLHPSVLDDLGLVEALRPSVSAWRAPSRCVWV